MKKTLVSLNNGLAVVHCGDYGTGYYKEYRFLWYSKKEIKSLLRHKYNVVVPRGF